MSGSALELACLVETRSAAGSSAVCVLQRFYALALAWWVAEHVEAERFRHAETGGNFAYREVFGFQQLVGQEQISFGNSFWFCSWQYAKMLTVSTLVRWRSTLQARTATVYESRLDPGRKFDHLSQALKHAVNVRLRRQHQTTIVTHSGSQ